MNTRGVVALLCLSIFLAGCSAPQDAAVIPSTSSPAATDDITQQSVTGSTGTVGGSVSNSAPVVQQLTPDVTVGENRGGFVVTYTGRVFDRNTETQIQNISVTGVGPSVLSSDHVVTADERNATTAPADFDGSGWKVWTGTRNDGILEFQYRRTFPAFTPAGAYSFQAFVSDKPGLSGASTPVVITLQAFSDITISPAPVDASGNPLASQNWGQWAAEAGATNVEASNYLKLLNTGDVAGSAVVIDFANSFVGAEDSTFAIPTANNLQFAFAQGPATATPGSLTFSYLPANADGTVTVTFTEKGNALFVKYRIVQVPDVLPVQSYGISFTVTEL